ncbi:hypothetical protein [Algoriphagus sediminis]|uniref:Translocation/assembly module TamB n=1 Tax=Algoriphagus sediminis TaxID=3057113 RepID=A0ABT7YF62_9BACT|nr:hypothetical protein [Algoriphagus sediminis]MDN3204839.1 hypothetical protein [Algoriphagus sediminis]
MSEKKLRKIKGHRLRKSVLRVVIGILLAVLFLEFIVYFGSNLLLANWARRKVNEASSEIYTIDFNRLNISLIRRGVFLDGIVMKPNPEAQVPEDQTLFDFSLDQLALKGSWYSADENIFYLGRLEFDNPNVKLTFSESSEPVESETDETVDRESPVKSLEREIRKTIESSPLNALVIREIEIINADLFFLNFLSDNNLQVQNSKLQIQDVNWTTQEEWTTPFNARGFEFEMEKGQFLLPDEVHTIKANRIFISSIDQQINLQSFEMIPDRSKESQAYYELSLDELQLKKVDLNSAFQTSELEIEEIILNEPSFNVARSNKSQNTSEQGTTDLNDLIEGILNSIEVQELSVNRGQFVSSDLLDSLKNRIELGNLDFKMVEFYLGDDVAKKENQFFYGDDASMAIRDVEVYLSDGVHKIQGESVAVNSFTNQIAVKGFKISPRDSVFIETDPRLLLKVELPELKIDGADLKRFYNDGIFDVSTIRMDNPQVEIVENESVLVQTSENKAPINELLEGYMRELRVKSFDLNDGVISFSNSSGIRNQDLGFDRFSLLLEDIFIEPEKVNNTREFFLANELVLDMDNYRLKLKDNIHEFSATKVIIDSKNDRVELQGFRITPPDSSQVKGLLNIYDKTAVMDMDVPYFAVEDIDLKKAFFEETLEIGLLTIPSSSISLERYGKRPKTSTGTISSDNDLESLLTQYFKSITIDSLNFLEGDLEYQNFSGSKSISITEDDLSLALKNFHVERGLPQGPDQTFFSDEIDISFKDYAFSLAGGNYTVLTNNIRYNSKAERINIDNLTLRPSPSLESKVILNVGLPEVVLEGVNIDRFLFDNILELRKLKVVGSDLNLELNPALRSASSADSLPRGNGPELPPSIDKILIDSVEADQSFLQLQYLLGETDIQSIETRFDLLVQGFNLDSISASEENISSLFDQITIDLQDFSFALPDSIHTLKFSELELNTATDESVFKDFQVIPNSISGHSGKPIISAQIPFLAVQNNKLASILGSQTFNITQVKLTDPEVFIYLDKEAPVKDENSLAKPKKEQSTEGLISSILLDDVLLENGGIQIFNKENQPIPKLNFNNVNVTLKDLNLELLGGKQEMGADFFLDQNLDLSLANYTIFTSDSLNKLTVGKVTFKDESVELADIWFRPALGRYEYLRKIGFQTDAIEAKVSGVILDQIDFDVLAESRKVRAGNLLVDSLSMDIFRDKRLPLKEGVVKPMPQELMQNFPIYVELDSVIVKNSQIRYQEFVPKSSLVGTLQFEDINASIAPFILTPDTIAYPLKKARMYAEALVEGQGDVRLDVDMKFEAPYEMAVDVRLGAFDLTNANDILTRTSFIGVKSGQVTDGKWKFKINENEAWGRMKFFYEDLKVEFLDTLTLLPGKGKLSLYTFAANTALKNKNPRGLFKKKVSRKIYYQRDKSKFIFAGWWKATFSGLKSSVGLGRTNAPARKEDEFFEFE